MVPSAGVVWFCLSENRPAITKPLELMTLAANLANRRMFVRCPTSAPGGRRRFRIKIYSLVLRHGYGRRRRALDSNLDSKSLRAVRRMKGVSIMAIRSLARNAARSEHLRNVRRRSRPAKGKRSWTPAEQETVKLLFPNRRSLEKALPDRTWIAICAHAGFLGLRKKQHRWLACDLSKLKRMWCAGATKNELCEALPRYS